MISKLLQKLKASKSRRDLFVAGQIKTGIPFQVRALRDKKQWTQAQLGAELGMNQTNVSRLESPGYGRLNITTLQRIASVFDVALIVRFVPFSELIRWTGNLSPEVIAPPSFEEEIDDLEQQSAFEAAFAAKPFTTSAIVTPLHGNTWGKVITSARAWHASHPDTDHVWSSTALVSKWESPTAHVEVGLGGDIFWTPNTVLASPYIRSSSTQILEGVM